VPAYVNPHPLPQSDTGWKKLPCIPSPLHNTLLPTLSIPPTHRCRCVLIHASSLSSLQTTTRVRARLPLPPQSLPASFSLYLAMATVITAQPNNLWQRQPDVYINIPFMGMSDFQPTCGTFKTYTNPILSRTFQEGPSVGSTMSTYSSNPMGKSMPYHPSGIPFDSVLANTYTLPPHFPIRYANPVGFQTTASVQSSPPVRHERQQVASESNPRPGPVVKVETSSPVQSSNVLSELPVKDTCEQTSTPRANFNTHIDTLMKAIQAKQKSDPSRQLPPKVCTLFAQGFGDTPRSPKSQEEDGCGGHRRRLIKRHQCAIEGCDKRFAQRTHLQIHIRSHTGEKPFVSSISISLIHGTYVGGQLCKHVGCGEGFSQLGNLKVSAQGRIHTDTG
jgi:hypothetical protein